MQCSVALVKMHSNIVLGLLFNILFWFGFGFLSISHGTGCSVAMLLVIAACCPTPFSVSIYFCIFASINHISLFNNNMNS